MTMQKPWKLKVIMTNYVASSDEDGRFGTFQKFWHKFICNFLDVIDFTRLEEKERRKSLFRIHGESRNFRVTAF